MISSSISSFPAIIYDKEEAKIADNLVDLYMSKRKNKSAKGKLKLMNVISISVAVAFKAPMSLIVTVPTVLTMSFIEMTREDSVKLEELKIRSCIVEYLEDYNQQIKTNENKAREKLSVISLANQIVELSKSRFH
jgi:hypothetical protein